LSVHRLTKTQARRIAVRGQLLDAPRPTDLLTVVRQLTAVQSELEDLASWLGLDSVAPA
jgi:hypothetical protein